MDTNTPTPGLSQPQLRVIEALVTGSSITDAAAAAGVHRCTIHAWCRGHREFSLALVENKKVYAEIVLDHYRGLVASAAGALREIIEHPDTPKGVRLKAALAVLNTVSAAAKQAGGEDGFFFLDHPTEIAASAAAAPQPPPVAESEPVAARLTPQEELLLNDPFHPAAPCPCESGQPFGSCRAPLFAEIPRDLPAGLPATRAA